MRVEPNAEHLPHSIDVKRMPKACNNATQRCIIMRMLGFTLAPYLAEYKPIITSESAPLHLHWSVLTKISAPSCGYVVIPAHTTWLLQPSDTHVRVLDTGSSRKSGLPKRSGRRPRRTKRRPWYAWSSTLSRVG